jgi:hypothetical protein
MAAVKARIFSLVLSAALLAALTAEAAAACCGVRVGVGAPCPCPEESAPPFGTLQDKPCCGLLELSPVATTATLASPSPEAGKTFVGPGAAHEVCSSRSAPPVAPEIARGDGPGSGPAIFLEVCSYRI